MDTSREGLLKKLLRGPKHQTKIVFQFFSRNSIYIYIYIYIIYIYIYVYMYILYIYIYILYIYIHIKFASNGREIVPFWKILPPECERVCGGPGCTWDDF